MGQCPISIPSDDNYESTQKRNVLTKLRPSANFSLSPSNNSTVCISATATLSNSSSKNSDNEYTSLKNNHDALIAKYRHEKSLTRFNPQLKVQKENNLVVDLSTLKSIDNTRIIFNEDEPIVEVLNIKGDQGSNVTDNNSTLAKSTAGTDITFDNSIATMKISNMLSKPKCATRNVQPILEEKKSFDATKYDCDSKDDFQSLFLYKAIPEDVIEDNILHLSI